MNNKGAYSLVTPEQVSTVLADRIKELRLIRKWKQSTLAERAGVSLASLRRFEQTGQISLSSLLRLSFALGRLSDYDALLRLPPAESIAALEARTAVAQRKRGSQ